MRTELGMLALFKPSNRRSDVGKMGPCNRIFNQISSPIQIQGTCPSRDTADTHNLDDRASEKEN